MHIFRSFKTPKEFTHSTLAIGNFDGIHIGHQAVIKKAISIAKKKKIKVGVLTFEPHPKCFFKKKYDYFRLTPFREKVRILSNMGIDFMINIRFEEKFVKKSAFDFLQNDLVGKLKVNSVVTGYDFVFGNNRTGNVNLINKFVLGTNKFKFFEVPEVKIKNMNIASSSEIRNFLREGEIQKANRILTRSWLVSGKVIGGDRNGRKIGFRTANMRVHKFCNIRKGVYFVSIKLTGKHKDKTYFGIANFGIKPTFDKVDPILETHIFNFCDDIYNQRIEISFNKFIRAEKKFESVEKLKDQIIKDIIQVKNDRLFKNN